MTRGLAVVAVAFLALAPRSAGAVRPTEGGIWSYDDGDVVLSHDDPGGLVRVHYTAAGAHTAPAADVDADGVPDYVAQVGATVDEVFASYEKLGVRTPLFEAELGLGELGGSPAFDVYLLDFAGNADGIFLVDACDGDPPRCAGAFAMENDFAGYGYASTTAAIDTVTSHELFHAVQGAYAADLPLWFSEGTATWAERQFRADSEDFLRLCDYYLADTTRSLYKPPAGPVPAFAYGTALWFDFLTTRHSPALLDEILVAAADDPAVITSMEAAISAADDTLAAAWATFAAWNLATGERAGEATSHTYAAKLDGVVAEDEGPLLADDTRYFSLTATYYRLDHAGGPLWFGLEQAAPPLVLSLHAVVDGADGPVGEPLMSWPADAAGAHALADLPAGGYWLLVAHPALADQSSKMHFCLGDEAHALSCAPATDSDSSSESGDETGEPTSTGEAEESGEPDPDAPTSDETGAATTVDEVDGESGCGCRTTSPPWTLLALLAVLPRRKRTST